MNYRLPKSERLHADKLIKELFNEGSSFFLYPFKVQYFVKKGEDAGTTRVLFSVSKKKIKKAVGRNYVKRRIKEAYRLNKSLLPESDHSLSIGLIYVSSDLMEFSALEPKVIQVLERLTQIISENHTDHE
ncbi:ribonuclease P protein component [Algoriphagus halophytocola]|uniref:Ribonuclease P protein component n=1 Tax=Algoriphagus halophytocola TaxID=2991499 RepID=A0ABY6MEI3_9BACT|nr:MULTISPECIES: ribonuclease P protein component [unclassified Algoriphagus]UZD22205.1 ribonuclease P protein component [Algoriphagus sp. TR-M5]WBL43455.1 ribonuclease P protein component [Algoriphagus sp. TR-M9]